MTSQRTGWKWAFFGLLLLAIGGSWAGWRAWQGVEISTQRSQASCKEQITTTRQNGEAQLAELQNRFDRYRAITKDPSGWFEALGRNVVDRTFVASLNATWLVDFELQDRLREKESLVGKRGIVEERSSNQVSATSTGFLLGRRSNFIFGLVQIN